MKFTMSTNTTPKPTVQDFLAVFLSAVSNTLKWGGASNFVDAVILCTNPQTVAGHFLSEGYVRDSVTQARLLACAEELFKPSPPIFAVGTTVRYTGEDYGSLLPQDTPLIVQEATLRSSPESDVPALVFYSVDGVMWIPHTELVFVAPPTTATLQAVALAATVLSTEIDSSVEEDL